ncbi:MAG: AAA family ATPase [Gammaproteobacteria bacterium]|nr:AAA family ATPase [Gammaproteobacteria bacterium]
MRINKLKLVRYGRFEDEELEFPKSSNGTDFQLVYGPNEAGKSSALMGLEDFLFGIPTRSPFGFQHGPSNMLIGAQLQEDNEQFEAVSKKGRISTLRHPDSNEVIDDGDVVLRTLLNQTSRDTFQRMFGLDHERLHLGGQSMLDADDDVGRALFAATSGLLGLQTTLDAWKVEADRQWAPNKSAKREYYRARERFDEASERVRSSTVLAGEWEDRRRKFEEIERLLEATREKIMVLEPRKRKLSRIRRLKAKVSRYFDIDQRIAKLGAVMEFASDAMETLNGLVGKNQVLAARIEEIGQRISQLKSERDALILDTQVLEDEDEIEELNERRSQIAKAKLDLPKREEELRAEQAKSQLLADKLGMDSLDRNDAAKQIPSREYSRLIHELIVQKRELDVRVKNCEDSLKRTTQDRARLQKDLNELGPSVEVDLLNASIEIAQRELDGIANLSQLQRQLETQTHEIQRIRRTLSPPVPEESELDSLVVPAGEVILSMRDEKRSLEREQTAQIGKVNDKKREVRTIVDQLERFLRDEELVSLEDLKALRGDRDQLWETLKGDLLVNKSPGDETPRNLHELSDRALAFEGKVSDTDALADKRFENAETEARYKELLRAREQSKGELRDSKEKNDEIREAIEKFQSRWNALWQECPFEVADPSTMLSWRETRESLVTAMQEQAETKAQAMQLIELEKQARHRLSQVIGELLPKLEQAKFDSLAEALAYSRELAGKLQEENVHRRNMQVNLKVADDDLTTRQEDWRTVQKESEDWSIEWSNALAHIGLSESERIERIAEKLELFDELRDLRGKIDDLSENRIGPIQSEIREFEERIKSKISLEYSDLEGKDALEIALELKKRLAGSRQTKARREDLSKHLTLQQDQKQEVVQEQRKSTAKIDEMQAIVGARDIQTLRECIRKSNEFQELRNEQSRLADELASDGDGLSLAELKNECDSVQDVDAARSDESELETQLEELRERENELLQKRTEAQWELDEIDGSDHAAHAEFDRECALAEMQDAVEKYIPIRASALILEWAIERFRREKQGPLLKRASEIFRSLTLGSFTQIEVQMEGGEPALVVFRENREEVRVSGLSEGSLDQLYLAMRLASIEEHLRGTKTSLPFVADDLLINFDDERATAGLRVLLELSHHCQVLFFTHHQHLVDLALKLGKDQIAVTEMKSAPALQKQLI